MDDQGIVVHASKIEGNGKRSLLSIADVEKQVPDQGLVWIHLNSANEMASEWLQKKFGISRLTCESLFDKGTRPRTALTNDGLLVILRGVNTNPGHDPEDMVALRMLFCETRIFTLSNRKSMAVHDMETLFETGNGPRSKGDFLVMVAERIADRIADEIQELDETVDDLEDLLLSADSADLQPKISDIRRIAIHLRRYIYPQRDVLIRLPGERVSWISDKDRIHLHEAAEQTARFVEDIDSARERSIIAQEEVNSRMSRQMNKAVYLLSIVTVIFLPLGLLTGLLGINVGGIPGAESRWAFPLVSLGIIAIAGGLILWFRRIKWL
ncbi:MAG: zinc transporter ZntB [Proteobacteria bacterium]|nr:zinc transporter ZntB [Pseudomonadota bacterium]